MPGRSARSRCRTEACSSAIRAPTSKTRRAWRLVERASGPTGSLKERPAGAGLSFSYSDAVIVIHGASPRGVTPVPGVVVTIFRRSLELRLGNAGSIAAKVGVVFQRLPGQGIMVVADPEE